MTINVLVQIQLTKTLQIVQEKITILPHISMKTQILPNTTTNQKRLC